jgi:hypothetical protein
MLFTKDQITAAKAVAKSVDKDHRILYTVLVEWGEEWMRFTATNSYILSRRTVGDSCTEQLGRAIVNATDFTMAMTTAEKIVVGVELIPVDKESLMVRAGTTDFVLNHQDVGWPNLDRIVPFGEFAKHRTEIGGDGMVVSGSQLATLIQSIGPARVIKAAPMRFGRREGKGPWLVLVEHRMYGRFEGGIMEVKVAN